MKYLGVLFLSFLSFLSLAQESNSFNSLSKGKQQVGAGISDMTSDGAYGLQLHLRYGYFLIDKLEVGLDGNGGARDYNIAYASVGPYVKYHLLEKWFSPFVTADSDFGYCKFDDDRIKYKQNGSLTWQKYFFGAGIGMYGLNDHWGFEASMGYQQELYKRSDDGTPTINITQWTVPIRWRVSYSF
ncbi:MAG: hypothetical protein ACPGD5_06430 [Salibacteraceae bacterium]